jgi:predicted metal-dependent phosphoesterase TrpH
MKRLKVDLHIHTKHSKDGEIEPKDLVKKAAELGFDAIAVTDHGTVKGAIETKEIARKTAKNLIVFVGQEVKTNKGEVLVYNVRKEIKEEQDLLKTCQEAKKSKGFLVVPHPFDLMRRGIGENTKSILGYVDAIEGFNARTVINRFNERAMEFTKENNKPMVVGSDSHFLDEFGKTYMLIESEKGERGILSAIEKGRFEIVMQKHDMKLSMKRGMRKIRTYF